MRSPSYPCPCACMLQGRTRTRFPNCGRREFGLKVNRSAHFKLHVGRGSFFTQEVTARCVWAFAPGFRRLPHRSSSSSCSTHAHWKEQEAVAVSNQMMAPFTLIVLWKHMKTLKLEAERWTWQSRPDRNFWESRAK